MKNEVSGDPSLLGKFAVWTLFSNTLPEHTDQLRSLWEKHRPEFETLGDQPDCGPKAGAFTLVNFTPRSLRCLWLLSYATIHREETLDLVSSTQELMGIDDEDNFVWPSSVPQVISTPSPDLLKSSPPWVAYYAASFIFLHEFYHIICAGKALGAHEEEFLADKFAVDFFLAVKNAPQEVELGRQRGISLAFFYISIFTAGGIFKQTSTHPAPAERILRVLKRSGFSEEGWDFTYSWICGADLISGLQKDVICMKTACEEALNTG